MKLFKKVLKAVGEGIVIFLGCNVFMFTVYTLLSILN